LPPPGLLMKDKQWEIGPSSWLEGFRRKFSAKGPACSPMSRAISRWRTRNLIVPGPGQRVGIRGGLRRAPGEIGRTCSAKATLQAADLYDPKRATRPKFRAPMLEAFVKHFPQPFEIPAMERAAPNQLSMMAGEGRRYGAGP